MNPSTPDPTNQLSGEFADVRELLAKGDKIGAIKRLREHTGCGLAEAKNYVEALPGGMPTGWTAPPSAGLTRARKVGVFLVAASSVVLFVDRIIDGHLIRSVGELAFGVLVVIGLGGFRFGLREKAFSVLMWSLVIVFLTTTILYWMKLV